MAVVGPQSPVEHPVPVPSSWLKSELVEWYAKAKDLESRVCVLLL